MGLNKVHQLEKAMVLLLNFEGWDLEWTGEGSERWDAKGKTQKGYDCVIEMKFRNKHYETKMLEKDKYDALMALDKDVIKIWVQSIKISFVVKKNIDRIADEIFSGSQMFLFF